MKTKHSGLGWVFVAILIFGLVMAKLSGLIVASWFLMGIIILIPILIASLMIIYVSVQSSAKFAVIKNNFGKFYPYDIVYHRGSHRPNEPGILKFYDGKFYMLWDDGFEAIIHHEDYDQIEIWKGTKNG